MASLAAETAPAARTHPAALAIGLERRNLIDARQALDLIRKHDDENRRHGNGDHGFAIH